VPERSTAEQAQHLLERDVPARLSYPFHIQIIKHGRRTCTAQRPKCPDCPLLRACPSARALHPQVRKTLRT
jgi:endonuclease-3